MKIKDVFGAVISILIALCAGFIGSAATTPNIPTWYAALNKPSFNPPNWIFAPVWTTLYIFMGIAAYLVWRKGIGNKAIRIALTVYFIQLALNAIWSILFFGQHLLLISFIELVILWLFILWTIVRFYSISVPAGLLLIPYILWVSFASVLNFFIWRLNP
jgi:benzodiazapine receptor